jgi:hypothetical protein
MKPHKEQALRCAIYTRKSSEEGLELPRLPQRFT